MSLPEQKGTEPARALRQFLEAACFERLATCQVNPEGRDRAVLTLGQTRFHLSMTQGAFGRPRIDRAIPVRIGDASGRAARIGDIGKVLEQVAGINPDVRNHFMTRLCDTDRNWRMILPAMAARSRRGLASMALDSLLFEGHPYHPLFCARSGWSDLDRREFAPEFQAAIRPVWLQIDARLCHVECAEAPADWSEWQAVAGAGTVAVPLHPWQFRHLRDASALSVWLDRGQARLLGEGAIYQPSQSLRTLFSPISPAGPHLKLPLSVAASSSLRDLEPNTIRVAPSISNWLRRIIDSDPEFSALGFRIQREFAAIDVDRGGPLQGRLGAIWRESPDALADPGETLLPFNALYASEADGRPLLDREIRAIGPGSWLDALIRHAVLPVWHLLIAHGVAIEAHGQNLMLRLRAGRITGLIARDFHESLEYVPGAGAKGSEPFPALDRLDPVFRDAPDGQFHRMANTAELSALFTDSLFVFNLAEFSALLARVYGFHEARFWRRVAGSLRDHAARLGLGGVAAHYPVFAPTLEVEPLLRAALGHLPETPLMVANPLAPNAAPESPARRVTDQDPFGEISCFM
ncbi:Siderophore synthetase component [Paracoccus halophilus]|uniref:Siderophore synthetase component n=1 Tax=Paracoccus halophilus TaxID=376733 RepID=A0A1I0U7F9_9RHOB|nr:IucA/IucC family protein [Paracoccus halophilus]SFA60012.1 Siderophore synthetase component [Paracoccus halophilus]